MNKPRDISESEWAKVLEQARAWKWKLVGSRYIGMGVRDIFAIDERGDEHRIVAVTVFKSSRL